MKKKHTLLIVVTIAVLVVLIAVLAFLNAPKEKVEAGSLKIVAQGKTVCTLDMAKIKSLPAVEMKKEIVSAHHDNENGMYKGVMLKDVIGAAGKDLLKNAQSVVGHAEDAFVVSYSADEVAEDKNIILVYEKDGKPLGTIKDGGYGPFRVIIMKDEFGNRSIKYLNEIDIK